MFFSLIDMEHSDLMKKGITHCIVQPSEKCDMEDILYNKSCYSQSE